MSMQYDVKTKTVNISNPGTFAEIGACRIKAIWFTASNAGYLSIVVNPGTDAKFLIDTLSIYQAGSNYILLPGEGIRAESDPYIYGNNLSTVTVFYG